MSGAGFVSTIGRSASDTLVNADGGIVSATDINATTVSQTKDGDAAGGTTAGFQGMIPQDIPPDMSLLLQKLEEDFLVNKTIDQWTYINRREEIIKSIQRIYQQQQGEIELDPLQLAKPLMPRMNPALMTEKSLQSESFADILASRAKLYKGESVFTVLDSKGKEISNITWDKLFSKAVRVASEIKKLSLKKNDTIVLLYKDGEVCEFAVAFFGCCIAKVTSIPIHQDISLHEVLDIINLTSSKLVLYSDTVAKELEKMHSNGHRIVWPLKLIKWRTGDFGSAKKSELQNWSLKAVIGERLSELVYVEFSRSPVGELRGVALSHRTILHQMQCLNKTLLSLPRSGGGLHRSLNHFERHRKVFLATLDVRLSIGLILGILFTAYSGNVLIWAPQSVMEVQGLYANILSKHRASLLLTEYIGLKRVTYDYQLSPNLTRYFSKTQKVDFSSVEWVLVNALTIDAEFIEILSQRYLRPLGCREPENAVISMLTLSEYGGMVISMRDWLGNRGALGIECEGDESASSEFSAVLIDKEALSRNQVKILETNPSNADDIPADILRVDAFGFPLPDATLAVVNPETSALVRKDELGEIWIDSPCLSGGFYGLRKESKLIFHAKCRDANGFLEMDFLRTGLLGFSYNGKVYVLGLYEDRIRQRISWIDKEIYRKMGKELHVGNGTRYHYSSHILATLAREVRQVYDCTIFDIFIGNEYLPVAIIEADIVRRTSEDVADTVSISSKGSQATAGDKDGNTLNNAIPLNEPFLNALAQRCFETLYKHHLLRLYCVLVVDIDSLPKIMRSGGTEIANMLCKKRFLEGSLKAEFVKFFVSKTISQIPYGEDVIGGIWSPYSSRVRHLMLEGSQEQYSTIDYRDESFDEKTGARLTDFKSIIDILKFRVASCGDSVAFQTLDNSKSSSKPLTWKKFEQRVFALCYYFLEKARIKPGKYVILMYSLSEEFVIAVYACLMCGIIPIPMLPFDSNRIGEDFPAFLGVIKDFDIQEIFVNDDVEKFLKNGPVSDGMKKMSSKKYKPQKIKNTTKISKVSNLANLRAKIAKYQQETNFRDENTTVLVWLNFTSDHYRVAATLNHKSLLGICKVFKETCSMTYKTPVLGCVRHSAGLGFIQAAILGVYLGTITYLMSPVTYAENPLVFFLALAKHKVKDVFVTEQMLKYASFKISPKGFNLANVKNMMIGTDTRIEVNLLRRIATFFLQNKLSASSMSAVYNHYFNPIIATRSYMTVAPVDLYLDPIALRQGFVSPVNPAESPNALHIQDSGMVPVCTEIAIVNPENNKVCREGEFGEIWVCSEANLKSFTNGPKGPIDNFTKSQFLGKIEGGNPQMTYVRTGDLGFLHHISITKSSYASSSKEEPVITSFQPLFVLGKIADSFEIMGLHHFPLDIENTIESCHPDIFRNGSCVFKCGDYTIVVCESKRMRNFASLVPLIVNTVLSKHHLIIDIVAFMRKNEFPISRLGTKQRARIVDAWVQGVIPLTATYGVNYGENNIIKVVKELSPSDRDDPITGLKNPAQVFSDDNGGNNVFSSSSSQILTLNV